jgi:voltage-gated sodium channel
MILSNPLDKCLRELIGQCENLQLQLNSLRAENQALKANASSARPFWPSPPGIVDEVEALHRLAAGAVSENGGKLVPLAVQPPHLSSNTVAPKSFAEPTLVNDKHADAVKPAPPQPKIEVRTPSKASDGEQPNIKANATTSQQLWNGTGGMQTLGAARLGMLTTDEGEDDGDDLKPVSGVEDALEMFGTLQGDPRKPILEQIATSLIFKSLCIFAIAANTVYIGMAADRQVKNNYRKVLGLEKEEISVNPDIGFAVWFTVELVIRIAAEQKSFFMGEDQQWNLFDCGLVVSSVAELVASDVFANLSFLRILRVFRLVRVVRVVRTVKPLKSLRTMVFALLHSFFSLLWAFLMIGIIMFVFGIIFDNAVSGYFDLFDGTNTEDEVAKAEELHMYFGSLWETTISLWSAISGGNDWMSYGEPLREIGGSDIYFIIFAFYIGFCTVGMLNVVTGIFVDSAVCTRTEDEVVECFIDDQKRTLEEVKRIFKEADMDGSGTLSCAELSKHLQHPWVKAYFSGLDIDPSDAVIIFALIDKDGTDSVSIDEFVDGTMKLKGNAKSIDVLSMMFDNIRFSMRFNTLCSYVEDELKSVKEAVAPGSTKGMAKVFQAAESVMAARESGMKSETLPKPGQFQPVLPGIPG